MLNLLSSLLQKFRKQTSLPQIFRDFFKTHKHGLILLYLSFGTYLYSVFAHMMYRTKEGLFIGFPTAWSDWALHISLTQIFAIKPPSEWFLYHPYYAHGKLTYGFLIHLITGLLMKLGIEIQTAFLIISLVFSTLFLLGIYFLYSQFTKKASVILLGIFIFFTSSGLGIFRYLPTITASQLFNPLEDYTEYADQYSWLAGNIPSSMLIPQRAYFIGATIGVWVLSLFLLSHRKKISIQLRNKLLLSAGILAGILPIAHMHTFIAMILITGTITVLKVAKHKKKDVAESIKKYLWYVLPAASISTILFFSFVYGGIEIDDFMLWNPGWSNRGGIFDWFIMWLQLWGAFIPLAAFAAYSQFKKRNMQILQIMAGFFAVFVVSNLIQFQPNIWDNTKLLSWTYLGFSIFIAQYLHSLASKSKLKKLIVIALMFVLSFSGIIELIRLQNHDDLTFKLLSENEMKTVEEIRDITATDAIFLTSSHHNHPVNVWGGRSIVMGYIGWIRNFGFDHTRRYIDSHNIYAGSPDANSLIAKYKISYIYLSSRERGYYVKIDENYLNSFPIIFENPTATVFDTRSLWQ